MKFKVDSLITLFAQHALQTVEVRNRIKRFHANFVSRQTRWRFYRMPEGENDRKLSNNKSQWIYVADVFDFSEIALCLELAILKHHHVAGYEMTFEFITNINGLPFSIHFRFSTQICIRHWKSCNFTNDCNILNDSRDHESLRKKVVCLIRFSLVSINKWLKTDLKNR